MHSPRISRPFFPERACVPLRDISRRDVINRSYSPGLQSPPHQDTYSGEYQTMRPQRIVSIIPTPTRHPDERSDANMQYPAHADLSTRLDSRWDILPAHVYYTTTSQRRAHIPRYDGVNSILDGTATPPRISYQRVLEHLLLTPPPRQISLRLAASRRCYSRVVSCS